MMNDKKRKRTKFSLEALTTLQSWLDLHAEGPYPTQKEKAHLSTETGLSEKQISTWFTNARKRKLSPMEEWLSTSDEESVAGGVQRILDSISSIDHSSLGGRDSSELPYFSSRAQSSASAGTGHSGRSAQSTKTAISQNSNIWSSGPRRGKRRYRKRLAGITQVETKMSFDISDSSDIEAKSPRFQCTFCGQELSPKAWKRHEETQHFPRKVWTCMRTGFTIPNLNRILEVYTAENDFGGMFSNRKAQELKDMLAMYNQLPQNIVEGLSKNMRVDKSSSEHSLHSTGSNSLQLFSLPRKKTLMLFKTSRAASSAKSTLQAWTHGLVVSYIPSWHHIELKRIMLLDNDSDRSGPERTCLFCKSIDVSPDHASTCHRIDDCLSKPEPERTFKRNDGLTQHLHTFHNVEYTAAAICLGRLWVSKNPARNQSWTCGFCGVPLSSWEFRAGHIAKHFREGCSLNEWVHNSPERIDCSVSDSSASNAELHHHREPKGEVREIVYRKELPGKSRILKEAVHSLLPKFLRRHKPRPRSGISTLQEKPCYKALSNKAELSTQMLIYQNGGIFARYFIYEPGQTVTTDWPFNLNNQYGREFHCLVQHCRQRPFRNLADWREHFERRHHFGLDTWKCPTVIPHAERSYLICGHDCRKHRISPAEKLEDANRHFDRAVPGKGCGFQSYISSFRRTVGCRFPEFTEFWCGFCMGIVAMPYSKDNSENLDKRLDYVTQHILEGCETRDWINEEALNIPIPEELAQKYRQLEALYGGKRETRNYRSLAS